MSIRPPSAAGQQAGFLVDLAVAGSRRQIGHVHGHDLLGGQLADAVQRTAGDDDVPDVQQQADVRRGHHVQQEREGVQIVHELEGLVLPQILGRLEADAEANAGRLQGPADLLEPPLVELEVLVIRPLVARRGHRGNATRATGGNRRLGILRQLLSGPWQRSRRRCPSPRAGRRLPIFSLALSISRRAYSTPFSRARVANSTTFRSMPPKP